MALRQKTGQEYISVIPSKSEGADTWRFISLKVLPQWQRSGCSITSQCALGLNHRKPELSEENTCYSSKNHWIHEVLGWHSLYYLAFLCSVSVEKKNPISFIFQWGEREIFLIKEWLCLRRNVLGKLLCYCCFICICWIFCTVHSHSKFS